MNFQPFVSVIIPTYNREDFLINLIKDLNKQDYPNFEVIIVDQGEKYLLSSIEKIISSLKIKIKYLHTQQRGASRARNIGLRNSRGDPIIFLDDDVTIPKNNFISEHIKCYSNEKIGGVSGRVIEKIKKPARGEVGKIFPIICVPGGKADGNEFTFVNTVKGMNMSFRRSVLEKIGGFDERFGFPSIYEETDVSLKIRRAGYKIIFSPTAEVIHHSAASGGQRQNIDSEGFRFIAFRDRVLLFRNNYPLWLFPLFFLGNIILAFRPILKLKLKPVFFGLNGFIRGIIRYLR